MRRVFAIECSRARDAAGGCGSSRRSTRPRRPPRGERGLGAPLLRDPCARAIPRSRAGAGSKALSQCSSPRPCPLRSGPAVLAGTPGPHAGARAGGGSRRDLPRGLCPWTPSASSSRGAEARTACASRRATADGEVVRPARWGDSPQNVACGSAGEAHRRRCAAVVAGMPDATHADIDVRSCCPRRRA